MASHTWARSTGACRSAPSSHRRRRLRWHALATLAAGALLVSACQSEATLQQQPGELGPAADVGTRQYPDAEGPLPLPADAREGGTLTVLTEERPATFDPTRAYYADSMAILEGLVTRSLTQYRYDPDSDTMVLVPDLATDLGQVSEDGLTWTFTLKSGIRFEDGTDVTAEDVAYGVKRAFATDILPDGPAYHLAYFVDGDRYQGPFASEAQLRSMPGYQRDWYAGADYDGVQARGNKVIIHLSTPFPDLPYYASMGVFSPIPEEKDTDPRRYGRHPIATGPYKFATYEPGISLTLVKNDQWDPSTDPGRLQAVDGFEFRFGNLPGTVESTILEDRGEAQTTFTYDSVSPSAYDRVRAQAPENLVEGAEPCTKQWFLDNRRITDQRVREALSFAYPYRDAWRAAGEIEGVTVSPATTLLPPGTTGRVEYEYPDGQTGAVTDPDRARDLLEEADAVGFEVIWPFEKDNPDSVARKDLEVQALRAAGFTPRPYPTTAAEMRALLSRADAPINVRPGSWCSDWPSGGSWFPAQWDGRLADHTGTANLAHFDQPAADAKQAEIMTMADQDAIAAWGEFDRWMMETYYPTVVTEYTGSAMIKGSRVGGMANDNVRGMPTLSRMYIKN